MNAKTIARRYHARMYRAITALRKGEMSIREAACRYHIPKSTVHDNIWKERSGHKSTKLGRKTALTRRKELLLIRCYILPIVAFL